MKDLSKYKGKIINGETYMFEQNAPKLFTGG